MVHGGRPLIHIGYKYNAHYFLYFIVTFNAGRKNAGRTYLSNYPDHFSNVAIHNVARPLLMYKFFGCVNEVYSHNK